MERNRKNVEPNFAFSRTGARFRDFTDKYIAENINFTGDWNSFMEVAKNSIINELNQKRNSKIFFQSMLI